MLKGKLSNNGLVDDFEIGMVSSFDSYNSAADKTNLKETHLIRGSKNVYKKLSGTIAARPGLKLRGAVDATAAGVSSSYEWYNSLGATLPIRVANAMMQVEYDPGTGPQWYTLLSGITDEKFSFAPWYSSTLQKDLLIFVNGQQNINMWGGGIGVIASAANTTGIISAISVPNDLSGLPYGRSNGGIDYVVGDILTVSGGNADAKLEVDSNSAATAVKTVTIANAGTGYAVNDIVKVSPYPTAYCLLKVTTIGGGGAVTGLTVVATGLGYGTGSGVATANVLSGGSSLTVNITAVASTIATWHFTNNGSGYSTGDAVATTGGTGTGATVSIFSVATGRVTITGTTTLSLLGFSGQLTPTADGVLYGGSFIVNGASWSYSALGDNGLSFIGFGSDPSALAGTVALSNITQNTVTASGNTFAKVFGANFTNDFINVIGNQLYVGCYKSRTVYCSGNDDYTKFAVPSLRAPGDPDIFVLDSNARGATSRTGQKGNAILFGSQGDSYAIQRNAQVFTSANGATSYIYELDSVDKATSSDLSSPLGQDFISSIGDTIIFLDQNNQLRQFGTLRNLVTPVYPILSLDIYDELTQCDFTGGHLRAVAEQAGETVYITAPITGVTYIYQIGYKIDPLGNLSASRIWQPPFIWNVSRIAVIDGVSYGHSNANPQLYQLWNTLQWHDDSPSGELPYDCIMRMAYRNGGRRQGKNNFDKVYVEGYIADGTKLYGNVYFDYQGSTNIANLDLNATGTIPTYIGSVAPSLGDSSLGDNPLGDGLSIEANDQERLPKFRIIKGVSPCDNFEHCLEIYTTDIDSRWEVLAIGTNMQISDNQAIEIVK